MLDQNNTNCITVHWVQNDIMSKGIPSNAAKKLFVKIDKIKDLEKISKKELEKLNETTSPNLSDIASGEEISNKINDKSQQYNEDTNEQN